MIQLHAELELTDCSAELSLNGVPLPSCPMRRPSFEWSVPVHHLLRTGMNELELLVDLEGGPSRVHAPRKLPPRPTAVAKARLVAYSLGVQAAPENGRVLVELVYRGDRDTGEEAPRVRRTAIDTGRAFGPWAFESAPVLTLDDALMREATAALARLDDALFSGDPDRVLDLVRVRWQEMDKAYPGRDDAVDRANHAAWIRELASDPRRRVPLDPGRHDFRLVAGGRLLECVDVDFLPSIRIGQEVEPGQWAVAPYPVLFARIGGRLVVAR